MWRRFALNNVWCLVFSAGLQAPGGAAFPGLMPFPAGIPGFSSGGGAAALSGLHNPAVQSALLQVSFTRNTSINHQSPADNQLVLYLLVIFVCLGSFCVTSGQLSSSA